MRSLITRAEVKRLASEPEMPISSLADVAVVEAHTLRKEGTAALTARLWATVVDYSTTATYNAGAYAVGSVVAYNGVAYVAVAPVVAGNYPSDEAVAWSYAPKFSDAPLDQLWHEALGPLIALRICRASYPSHFAQTKGNGVQVEFGASTRLADFRMKDYDRRSEVYAEEVALWLGSNAGAPYRLGSTGASCPTDTHGNGRTGVRYRMY